MALGEWIDRARELGRPGDLLILGTADSATDEERLAAARGLRDQLAFAGALEVLDLLVARMPDDIRVHELLALCLGRVRPDALSGARSHALRAAQLAHDRAEPIALVGRLYKQSFALAVRAAGAAVAARRAAAAEALPDLIRAIDSYTKAHDRERAADHYAAINALTLLTVLADVAPAADAYWTPARIEAERARLLGELTPAIDTAARAATTDEERYWARASRVEIAIVADTNGIAGAVEDLWQALRLEGTRLFFVDSTRQQLELLASLGVCGERVAPLLAMVDRWLALAPRPDRPRTRVVFAGHRVDEPGCTRSRFSANDEALAATAIRAALRAVVDARGDVHGLVSAACGGDLLFAEACGDAGVPFAFHLPFAEPRFLETSVRTGGEAWVGRFRELTGRGELGRRSGVRSATDVLELPAHLDALGASAPFSACNEWMLATARAYGVEHAVLIALWDGEPGSDEGGTAHAVERARALGVRVVHVPLRAGVGTADVTISGRPPRATSAVPAPLPVEVGGVPAWLRTVADAFAEEKGDPADRWAGYLDDETARAFFGTLDLRFEPVEQFTPKLMTPPLLGFEVLGMLRDGSTYGTVLKRAREAKIDDGDLDIAVFGHALSTLTRLRDLLQQSTPGAARLWFTLNVNDAMLRARPLGTLLRHGLTGVLREKIQLELSENFPKGLAAERDDAKRAAILADARAIIDTLLGEHGVHLTLDDSDQLHASMRAMLGPRARKAKADARYVRDLLHDATATRAPPAFVVGELDKHRVRGIPYVLEGVETAAMHDFLRTHWPDDDERATWLQGYAIRVPPELRHAFSPLHTEEQPRGYRVVEELRDALD